MLTSEEHKWLKRCADALHTNVPRVAYDNTTADVAYNPANQTILLGKKFHAHRPNTFIRRQKLLHEQFHHWGLEHNKKIRYDTNPDIDFFSRDMAHALERSIGTFRKQLERYKMPKNPLNTPYNIYVAARMKQLSQQGLIEHSPEGGQKAMRQAAAEFKARQGKQNPQQGGGQNRGVTTGFRFNPQQGGGQNRGVTTGFHFNPIRRSSGDFDFRKREAELEVTKREDDYRRVHKAYGDDHPLTRKYLVALMRAENKILRYSNPTTGATIAPCPHCKTRIAVPDGAVSGYCIGCNNKLAVQNPKMPMQYYEGESRNTPLVVTREYLRRLPAKKPRKVAEIPYKRLRLAEARGVALRHKEAEEAPLQYEIAHGGGPLRKRAERNPDFNAMPIVGGIVALVALKLFGK